MNLQKNMKKFNKNRHFQLLENYVISWSKKAFFRVRHFWISQVGRDDTYLFSRASLEYTLADISQRMLEIAEAKAQSNVVFLHQSQERLIETGKKFQVVFSAMNPALDTPEKVNALCQLSEEWCLIFRLVEEQDSLFSPFEQESNPQLNWMAKYKAFLKKEQRPFFTKKFFFEASETISKDFFRSYFEEQWSVPILEQRVQEIFGSHEIKQNQRTIIYELIVIPCKKTTSDD